ncbi:hypothetical protein MKX31_28260 [Bacillus sp. FSL M8-0063]|uniref:hypothetical protein n=1 Tax=Bacillus sp. FSL M8-0063 TaxID=2921566 RepID=UPI0030F93733
MKHIVVGNLFTWIGSGTFAIGIQYGVNGNPFGQFIQFALAMVMLSYGMSQIVKGGKEL